MISAKALSILEPVPFQRFAIDALAAHAATISQRVRGLDLGTGRRDQGFDGVRLDRQGQEWRVEVKSTASFGTLLSEARDHFEKYDDLPTLLITRIALTEAQRHQLNELRSDPPVDVVDGSQLSGWARAHRWVAVAWGLLPTASQLSPVGYFVANDDLPFDLVPSEGKASASALAAIDEGNRSVVIDGDRFSRPTRVLRALVRRLAIAGDSKSRVVAVLGIHEEPPKPSELRDLLGANHAASVLVVVMEPQTRTPDTLLSLSGMTVVFATRGHPSAARGAQRHGSTQVVSLPAPTSQERRTIAQAASGREGLDVDASAVWLRDPDLIERLQMYGREALDAEVHHKAATAAGREAASWVGLLGKMKMEHVKHLGIDAAALKTLQRAGLVDVGHDGWTVTTPAMGQVVIRVWTEDDDFQEPRFVERFRTLPVDVQSQVLKRMVAASDIRNSDRATIVAAELLETASEDTLRVYLEECPEVFAASWCALETAYALVRARPPRHRAMEKLIAVASSRPAMLPDAIMLLLESSDQPGFDVQRRVRRLAHALFDPFNGTTFDGARRGLEVLRREVGTGAARNGLADVVGGAADVWLSANLRFERNYPTGLEFGGRPWNDTADLRGVFERAAAMLVAGMVGPKSTVRDASWTAYLSAGRPRGTPHAEPPQGLIDVLRAGAREVIGYVSQLEDPVERDVREAQLARMLGTVWGREDTALRDLVTGVFTSNPESRLLRRVASGLADDTAPAAIEARREGRRPAQVPRATVDTDDDEAISNWLDTNPVTEDLLRLLGHAAQLLDSGSGIPFARVARGAVLEHLAELRPDLVEQVIFSERWDDLPHRAKTLLADCCANVFGARLREALVGDEEPSQGLLSRLHRFARSPDDVPGREGHLLAWLLQRVVPDDQCERFLMQLASAQDRAIREQAEWWYWTWWSAGHGDGPPGQAILARLVGGPAGFSVLASLSRRMLERGDDRPVSSELMEILLDALVEHALVLHAGEENSAVGDFEVWNLDPLLHRLRSARLEDWWRIAPFLWGNRSDQGEMVATLSGDSLIQVLLAGPADSEAYSDEAGLLQQLVRSVDSVDFYPAVRGLLNAGDLVRAVTWMSARQLEDAGLEVLSLLLGQMEEERRDSLVLQLSFDAGLYGFGGGTTIQLDPFGESTPFEPPDIVGKLRSQAELAPSYEVRAALLRIADARIEVASQVHERSIAGWLDE